MNHKILYILKIIYQEGGVEKAVYMRYRIINEKYDLKKRIFQNLISGGFCII
jgi:hypothetical protein